MPNYFPVFLTEDSDLWSYPPRTRKKKRRIRKPTLARAVIEARKAGLDAATITIDGVTLEFGKIVPAENDIKPNGHAIETADELRRLI